MRTYVLIDLYTSKLMERYWGKPKRYAYYRGALWSIHSDANDFDEAERIRAGLADSIKKVVKRDHDRSYTPTIRVASEENVVEIRPIIVEAIDSAVKSGAHSSADGANYTFTKTSDNTFIAYHYGDVVVHGLILGDSWKILNVIDIEKLEREAT